jgi:hypothetical protein
MLLCLTLGRCSTSLARPICIHAERQLPKPSAEVPAEESVNEHMMASCEARKRKASVPKLPGMEAESKPLHHVRASFVQVFFDSVLILFDLD